MGNKFGDAYREERRKIHRRALGRRAVQKAEPQAWRTYSQNAFGNGEIGGGRDWEPPVHATATDGTPVTVSYGRGNRAGHQLVCRGHVSMEEFYAKASGHDHYGPNGELYADRGRS